MFDTQKFTKLIQERPALWDKAERVDLNRRDLIWMEIGELMYTDWSQISADEREEKVKIMKNKWRNLRDMYLRSLKCDYSSNKRKKYVNSEHLEFLLDMYGQRTPVQDKRQRTAIKTAKINAHTNGQANSGNNHTGNESCSSDSFEDTHLLKNVQSDSSPTKTSQTTRLTTLKSKLPTLKPKLPTLETSLSSAQLVETSPKEDADLMFFNSLLPDYKDLDDEEKLDFRIKCLQFIRDARKRNS